MHAHGYAIPDLHFANILVRQVQLNTVHTIAPHRVIILARALSNDGAQLGHYRKSCGIREVGPSEEGPSPQWR